MKILIFRITIISIFISSFIFLIGQQQVQAQTERALNFNEILSTLKSTSGIKKSIEEINEQLITNIRKRKVNFALTSESKNSLKKAGGNDFLVKTIVENLSERTKEKFILLQKYFTHYEDDIPLQAKRGVEIAKEYIRKFSNDEEDKELIEFFKKVIPDLEKFIAAIERKGRK